MGNRVVLEDMELPCGCRLRTIATEVQGEDVFIYADDNTLEYTPCRVDCTNYLNAIALAQNRGKQIIERRSDG